MVNITATFTDDGTIVETYKRSFDGVVGEEEDLMPQFERHLYTCDQGIDALKVTYTEEQQFITVNFTKVSGFALDDDHDQIEPVAFSLDNTKTEMQDELTSRGVKFAINDSKDKLLEKLNA